MTGHDHGAAARTRRRPRPNRARRRAMSRRRRLGAGRRIRALCLHRTCQHRDRHRLRAGPRGGFRIRRRHCRLAPGRVLGICRLCHLHAGAGPRPAAGTAGDAGCRPDGPPDLVGRNRRRHGRRAGADRLPRHGGVFADRRRVDRRPARHRGAAAGKPRNRRFQPICTGSLSSR